MPTKTVIASRSAVFAALALTTILVVQVAVAVAAGPETYAMPQVVGQQLPTPTPFRFLTPVPGTLPSTSTTTTTSSPSAVAPRAGGFPMELALPVLAGGLAAIGGGSFLLRRKKPA
jgi:hypothetical protein